MRLARAPSASQLRSGLGGADGSLLIAARNATVGCIDAAMSLAMALSPLFLLFLLATLSKAIVVEHRPCPEQCVCVQMVTRCIQQGLHHIPKNIPIDTTVLDLRFNHITAIRTGELGNLKQLHTLLLTDNQLRHIQAGAFDDLHALRNLYLYRNQLTTLSKQMFRGLDRLETLNLHRNMIEHIDGDAFAYMPRIRRLKLNHNRLRHVPHEALQVLPDLLALRLDQNTIACDCESAGLAEFLRERKLESDHGKVDCMYPPNMRGHALSQVPMTSFQCRKPTIVMDPKSVQVTFGGSAVFECRAEGDPAPQIAWLHNDSILQLNVSADDAAKYALLPDGSLRIANASATDAGFYECVANSPTGQARARRAQLIASPQTGAGLRSRSPTFTLTPKDSVVREGTVVKLHCEATADPRPVISWYLNGSPLRPSRRMSFDRDDTVLTIYPFIEQDVGRYTCTARNTFGLVESSANIRLLLSSPPSIVEGPTSVTLQPGGVAVFRCRAVGEPKPRLIWHFNGSPIPTLRGHYEVSDDETILTIRRVSLQDDGTYACQAGNTVGSMMADARLRVHNPNQAHLDREVTTDLIRQSVLEATDNVDRAINDTRTRLFRSGKKSPSEVLALFRFPGPQAVELARSREIYEETISIIQQHVQSGLELTPAELFNNVSYESLLAVSHLQMIMELSGCVPGQFKNPCTDMCFHSKYRSYDGQCNNLDRPMQGVSLLPFKRLLPPIYENGFNSPVGWNPDRRYFGFAKPNARSVSIKVISTDRITPNFQYSAMLMQWGQFLDHDLDFTAAATSREVFASGAFCNRTCDNVAPCFNIPLPLEDPRRNSRRDLELPCIEFERSSAACGSGETSLIFQRVSSREQMNIITSYLDASNVYGSTEQEALDLRDLFSDHGQLRFDIVSHAQKPYLPFNRDAPMDCKRNTSETHPIRCFMAGDFRANEQLGLLSMHTLWLREHNRIAGRFLVINPHWDGEKIYQETRKILGAQMQHITFSHWLPKILGPEGMKLIGKYGGYNPNVDATIANAFATAALRFGHSLINPTLFRFDNNFAPIRAGHLPLHEAFFAPERLLSEGGIDPILRGLFASPVKLNLPHQVVNREVTEHLFGKAHSVALDLVALNIQRGRDHGLPGYNEWRAWCNLTVFENWNEAASVFPDNLVRTKLRDLYGHPGNIDLWVGGIIEAPLTGGLLGPTFACIVANQFQRLRDGDRFWYENEGVFTPLQVNELRKSSVSRVLCENGDNIDRVQKDIFNYRNYSQSPAFYEPCEQIPAINLNVWQSCCESTCASESVVSEKEEDEDKVQSRHKRAHSKYRREDQTRIDGLEQVVEEMRLEIDRLRRETSQEKRPTSDGCTVDGKLRENGNTWTVDNCTSCTCKDGQVWCSKQTCPTPLCKKPLVLPFSCCPACA